MIFVVVCQFSYKITLDIGLLQQNSTILDALEIKELVGEKVDNIFGWTARLSVVCQKFPT